MMDLTMGVPGIYMATLTFVSRESTDTSEWYGDLLILDEAHKVATAGSKGQRKISGYEFKDNPLSLRFSHRLALSGTPMRQNFANMWATMRFLWPELDGRDEVAYNNHWLWCKDRMTSQTVYTSQRDRWGNPKTAVQFQAEKDPGLLLSQMPCAIVHKRREYCCEYHPNGFLTTEEPKVLEHVVDLTAKQKKAIKELEEMFMTYIDGNPLVTELSITQKQRIRQLCLGEARVEYYLGENKDGEPVEKSRLEFEDDCKSPFFDASLDILEQIGDEPAVVYLDSRRFGEVLVNKLRKAGITADIYSGPRKADLSKFGSEYRVLVAVTSAIGTGTDGLGKIALNEIWMEVPVSITDETQTQARLDRMGSRGQVQRWYIKDNFGYAEGRISDNVTKRLAVNASMRKVG